MGVDGTIEVDRLADVLYVGLLAAAQERTKVGLFKLQPDGTAVRVQIQIGRTSANAVEVTSGLNVGDQVILSDMSPWDRFDRIRLQ